jgi:hypothetical protein
LSISIFCGGIEILGKFESTYGGFACGRWELINRYKPERYQWGAFALNAVYCGRPIKSLMLAFLPKSQILENDRFIT